MYNRYVPGSNGVYERKPVQETPRQQERQIIETPTCVQERKDANICSKSCSTSQTLQRGLDIGDLLLLCIVLLLLVDSEEEDTLPLLIAAAVFLFS